MFSLHNYCMWYIHKYCVSDPVITACFHRCYCIESHVCSHMQTICSAVKGHVQMSKALSPKRQALPVDDEGNRLILNPQKPGKRNAVAIDMGKQMGRESKTDMDEGNVLKLSPHKIQRYARHIETTARC